jgi:hypothetical protein
MLLTNVHSALILRRSYYRYLHRGNRTIQDRVSTSETDDAQVIPMTVLASCAAPCAALTESCGKSKRWSSQHVFRCGTEDSLSVTRFKND